MTKKASKNTHGGAGRGQGRKSMGDSPKLQKTYKLSEETVNRLDELSEKHDISRALIIEKAIKNLNEKTLK